LRRADEDGSYARAGDFERLIVVEDVGVGYHDCRVGLVLEIQVWKIQSLAAASEIEDVVTNYRRVKVNEQV
jgi:hypothetical protein